MFHYKVSLLALLIISAVSSVTILADGTSHQISEAELSNYVSTMIGFNHQSIQMTPQLRKIANSLRLSLLNPIDKLTILLVIDNKIDQIPEGSIDLSNQLSSILPLISNKLAFSIIHSSDQIDVEEEIQKYASQRSVVVIIRESEKEINKISKLLQGKDRTSSRRLNQKQAHQQTTPDDMKFYLFKFFFSLLFIIVIIGIVSSIASNQGKKDTLLYAKFIADVSNSR